MSELFSSDDARLWRILVVGHSMSQNVPGRTSRLEGPYPEVLELLLRTQGINAFVRNAGREFDLIKGGAFRYQEYERMSSPDVVVIHYGLGEAQAPAIPRAIYNHLWTWNTGLRGPAALYRRRIAPFLTQQLRKWQRFAHPRMKLLWRTSPPRFAAELERMIRMARFEHRLVLVIDTNPPGPKIRHFLPGLDERREVMQTTLKDVVAKLAADDDEVRLVEASVIIEDLGIDATVPDGYHWSPEAHRRVAEMLAAEILPWIKGF